MATLPTGTVTFLFTDIEGSAKLWEQSSDAMKAALAQHDALMRQTIEAHNGYVFKTVGDAFCAAFATATDALAACLMAQRTLSQKTSEVSETSEVWPLRVRMGLHTGAPKNVMTTTSARRSIVLRG
jgi:class 3 adenylate cyclase